MDQIQRAAIGQANIGKQEVEAILSQETAGFRQARSNGDSSQGRQTLLDYPLSRGVVLNVKDSLHDAT